MAARPKRAVAATKKTKKKTAARKKTVRRPGPKEAARIEAILELLDAHFPDVECALHYETPFQLICSVILSAQCTDEMVNKVTPGLFDAYPDAASMAMATQESMERLVKSTGFYRNKSKNLIACARTIHEDFGGEVPADMNDLLGLAGVARKTANVVLGEIYGIAEGVTVDTHVKRISNLLGLTKESDPKKIEQDLMVKIPPEKWIMYSHQIIHHGRRTCIARRPRCGECFLAEICPGKV